MEIILKEDIIGLGYKNDIVNVKSGYGRNYLIPTGKAVIASPSAKKTESTPLPPSVSNSTLNCGDCGSGFDCEDEQLRSRCHSGIS